MALTSENQNLSSKLAFEELPDILIQDPVRECVYFLPANQMDAYIVSKDTWKRVELGTVTFVIPDESFISEVPPFNSCPDVAPSVLIQYPYGEKSYFLSFDQLQKYKTDRKFEYGEGYGISFIIPSSVELIEELPAVMRALLQSNESGSEKPTY